MIDYLHNYIVAAGDSGWEDLIVVVIFAGLAILRAIFSSLTKKKEQKNQQELQDSLRQRRRQSQKRYKPLDEQGRPTQQPHQHRTFQVDPEPVKSDRQQIKSEPITIDTLQIEDEPKNNGLQRYKERIEQAKRKALAQRRIAQQVMMKSKKATHPQDAKSQTKHVKPTAAQAPHKNTSNDISPQPIEINLLLSNPENLRSAFILTEILNKPLALRN